MHCLVIEDRKKMVDGLVALLERLPGIEAVHTSMHPYEIRYLLRSVKVSLVVCSPNLWNYSYFDGMESVPRFVFVSNSKDKIKDDEDSSDIEVVREPFNAYQWEKCFCRLEKKDLKVTSDFFFVKVERRWRPIKFSDIQLVEKKPGNYVQIWTVHSNYLVAGTLNNWLNKLPEDRFIRPCDNLLVPFKDVQKITGDVYSFRGRGIKLTFRLAKRAKREMEAMNEQF